MLENILNYYRQRGEPVRGGIFREEFSGGNFPRTEIFLGQEFLGREFHGEEFS